MAADQAPVRLVPARYFQILDRTMNGADLKRRSLTEFTLQARGGEPIIVTDIVVDTDGLLGWTKDDESARNQFSVWVKSLPPEQVFSTRMYVHYKLEDGDTDGAQSEPLVLDVRIFVRETGRHE